MSQHGCPERLSNMSKGFHEGGSSGTMELLVETLTGTAFEMTVSPSDTIFAIKSKIFRVEGIPVSQQHLLYNLKELEDSRSLSDSGVCGGATLRLVVRMRGGPVATRRAPPPVRRDHDLDPLLHANRDEEWGSSSGCKVTVLVFRDGERVNMLRVRENSDGTYSPIDHTKYSPPLSQQTETPAGAPSARSVTQNAVTMSKMAALRRRMELLALRRAHHSHDDKAEIQKTRSEETLTVPSLLEEDNFNQSFSYLEEPEDSFGPVYDGNYSRYDYDCSFADRYTLLPPIGSRTDSDLSVQEESTRGRGEARAGGEQRAATRRGGGALAGVPSADCGGVVTRVRCGWRGFGSSSQLSRSPPLTDAVFSSSTGDLQTLTHHRLLPALSRHRNRERLHLSDDALHRSRAAPPATPPVPPPRPARTVTEGPAASSTTSTEAADSTAAPAAPAPAKKPRMRCAWCRRRLSICSAHCCRCGHLYCPEHRYQEVHGCAYEYRRPAAPAPSLPRLPRI